MNLELIDKLIRPSSILDIGANAGWFGDAAMLKWPEAMYLAIEGNPACAEMLRSTGRPFVIALLSDTEREVDFYTRKDAATCTGASYMLEQTEFYRPGNVVATPLQTMTLDKVTGGDAYDLVKIDTQGSELDVMRGGEVTISKAKAVVIEISHVEYNKGSPSESVVDGYMRSIGFTRSENIGVITHPITGSHIQTDRAYLR